MGPCSLLSGITALLAMQGGSSTLFLSKLLSNRVSCSHHLKYTKHDDVLSTAVIGTPRLQFWDMGFFKRGKPSVQTFFFFLIFLAELCPLCHQPCHPWLGSFICSLWLSFTKTWRDEWSRITGHWSGSQHCRHSSFIPNRPSRNVMQTLQWLPALVQGMC